MVIILKDSATLAQKDPRQAMIDEIESSYTDSPVQIVDSVGIGVAHQIIRSYGGTLKFIQNHFYTQATIKFPIDLNGKDSIDLEENHG